MRSISSNEISPLSLLSSIKLLVYSNLFLFRLFITLIYCRISSLYAFASGIFMNSFIVPSKFLYSISMREVDKIAASLFLLYKFEIFSSTLSRTKEAIPNWPVLSLAILPTTFTIIPHRSFRVSPAVAIRLLYA